MEKTLRQKKVLESISSSTDPVSGSELALKFGVTRQIIVRDVMILKAQGEDIRSNSRGYYINSEKKNIKTVAVRHSMSEIRDELLIMVNNNATVVDIVVEHPVYGEITGAIGVSTVDDVQAFCARIKNSKPLSSINKGVHIHHIIVEKESDFQNIIEQLEKHKILLK